MKTFVVILIGDENIQVTDSFEARNLLEAFKLTAEYYNVTSTSLIRIVSIAETMH